MNSPSISRTSSGFLPSHLFPGHNTNSQLTFAPKSPVYTSQSQPSHFSNWEQNGNLYASSLQLSEKKSAETKQRYLDDCDVINSPSAIADARDMAPPPSDSIHDFDTLGNNLVPDLHSNSQIQSPVV